MIDQRIPMNEDLAGYRVTRGFFFTTPHLLCIADRKANIIDFNKAWEEKLGMTEDELRHKKLLLDIPLIVHPDDMQASLRAIEMLGKQDSLVSFRAEISDKSGVRHNFNWRVQQRGNHIYAAAREISAGDRCSETRLRTESSQNLTVGKKIDHSVVVLRQWTKLPVFQEEEYNDKKSNGL